MSRITTTTWLVAGCLVLGSVCAAEAQYRYAQSIPGATCKPTNRFEETYYRYQGRALVNVSENEWLNFVSACPVVEVVQGARLEELRIVIRDPARRDSWCDLYSVTGERIDQLWVDDWFGDLALLRAVSRRGISDDSMFGHFVSLTAHCLLRSGVALEKIELIWIEN